MAVGFVHNSATIKIKYDCGMVDGVIKSRTTSYTNVVPLPDFEKTMAFADLIVSLQKNYLAGVTLIRSTSLAN